MLARVALSICVCSSVFAGEALAKGGGYSITTVADSNTSRPDGQGNFALGNSFPPSLDGNTVLIQNYAGTDCSEYPSVDSLWTSPASGGSYSKLVAAGDKAPGGTGNFETLAYTFPATAENGVVAFSSGDDAGPGVYTLPLTGGTPSLMINYKHTVPDGAAYSVNLGSCEFVQQGLSTDGTQVAINPANSRLLVAKVGSKRIVESVNTDYNDNYPMSPDLPLGEELIPPPDNCPFSGLGAPTNGPSISGNNLFFTGGSSGSGGNSMGLYATPADGFQQGETNSCYGITYLVPPFMADWQTALPGDPNGSGNEGFDMMSADGSNLAYIMYDWTDNYECVVLENGKGTKTDALACSDTQLPGMTTMPITFLSVAYRDGVTAFVAKDSSSNNNYGLYIAKGKKVSKVIASGDALDGGTVTSEWQHPALAISERATSGGDVAFYAQVTQSDGSSVYGNFVAQPAH